MRISSISSNLLSSKFAFKGMPQVRQACTKIVLPSAFILGNAIKFDSYYPGTGSGSREVDYEDFEIDYSEQRSQEEAEKDYIQRHPGIGSGGSYNDED